MDRYLLRSLALLTITTGLIVLSVVLKIPPASSYPFESFAILISLLYLLWRPIVVSNGMTLGEAMEKAPHIAAMSLVGVIAALIVCPIIILLRELMAG